MNSKGKHEMIDIIHFFPPPEEGGKFIFHVLKESLKLSSCKEVHSQLVILGLDGKSPPGFTSVILIDESHLTAHCYSDSGLLAIDVFTCGSSVPTALIEFIISEIIKNYPNIAVIQSHSIERFLSF